MDWQPIETAPKDGTWVLMFREGRTYVARWCGLPWNTWGVSAARIPAEEGSFTDIGPQGFGSIVAANGPTHWMPLPAPPKEASE